MKNIRYLFVLIFAVLLSVSCGSDDDSSSEAYDPALVGTWEVTEVDEDFGYEFNLSITFMSNQTGTATSTSTIDEETETETNAFTWSTNGNKLTLKFNGESPETATYSISGNKLNITDEDGDVTVLTKV